MTVQSGAVKGSCNSCGAKRFINRREFDRAARITCYECGGTVDVCSSTGQQAVINSRDAGRTSIDAAKYKSNHKR